MKDIVLALLMGLAGPAAADLTGVINLRSGAVINLHSDDGLCTHGAHRAEFFDPTQRLPNLTGCWAVRPNGVVTIGWLNGYVDAVPLQAIELPKAL
jgi:hypothetical protein